MLHYILRDNLRKYCWSPLVVSVSVAGASAFSFAKNTEYASFDTGALQTYGLNPEIASYYAERNRFLPGNHNIVLSVNGKQHGRVKVYVNDKGQVCINEQFLESAGLNRQIHHEKCPTLQQYWHNAQLEIYPATEEIAIIVPVEAINIEARNNVVDIQGGSAAMLNYSLFGTKKKYGKEHSDRMQSTFNIGFNSGDWIVRSTQLISDGSQQSFSSDSLYTYAQRTFSDYGVVFQGGEINIVNSRFSVPTLYGFQIMPDTTLLPQDSSGVEVTGIARSAQARVDVRQSGKLIYSTLVPAGPFRLTDIPILNVNTDLNVTVTENEGSEHHYIVAAAQFRYRLLSDGSGISFSAGQAKKMDNTQAQPWVIAASNGWRLHPRMNMLLGVLMGDNRYYGFSVNFDAIPLPDLNTSLGLYGSIDNFSKTDGYKVSADMSYLLPFDISIRGGGSKGSDTYREMTEIDADNDDFSATKYDANVGIAWASPSVGRFSLSYYRSKTYNSRDDSQSIIAAWSKTFKYATATLNWQSDISRGDKDDNDMLYLSLSFPLGHGVMGNGWLRNNEGRTSYGTRVTGSVDSNNAYSLGISRDHDMNASAWDGSFNSNLRYTSASVSVSGDNRQQQSYSASLRGGVVAHVNGMTFSPWPIDETFGLMQLDKPIAGIEIETSRGSVWTDPWGYAVIPSVQPYQTSSLNLNTQTLPGNLDVKNGKAMFKASRGAFAHWEFSTLSQRRVLFSVMLDNGKPLPKGTSIVNATGEYMTSTADDGIVFLNDLPTELALFAKLDDRQCRLNYELPASQLDEFFTEISARCDVIAGELH